MADKCTKREAPGSIVTQVQDRDKVIVRASVVGIVTNVILAAGKAAVGLLANSIAVVLDAVNNLSDALSSVITIVGTKLSGKAPDKKHPLGYGRIEYLSAMIVAAIVLYAGLTSLVESVKKIIHPETAEYTTLSLVLIGAAVAVKLILGSYVKSRGKKVNSGSLIASGSDATFDAILSASVLASAVIFLTTGLSLEAYVGAVISCFIIKSGVEMLLETLNDILGSRADPELSRKIKEILVSLPEVRGAYDLNINNYGPEKNYASVHLELPDTMAVADVDRLTREAQMRVYQETGVILTGVGVYSFNTGDTEAARMQTAVTETLLSHDWVLQVHGFYVDETAKLLRFDAVMSFDVDPREGLETLRGEVAALYPDYQIVAVADTDISD